MTIIGMGKSCHEALHSVAHSDMKGVLAKVQVVELLVRLLVLTKLPGIKFQLAIPLPEPSFDTVEPKLDHCCEHQLANHENLLN